jgi:hypothetical protein
VGKQVECAGHPKFDSIKERNRADHYFVSTHIAAYRVKDGLVMEYLGRHHHRDDYSTHCFRDIISGKNWDISIINFFDESDEWETLNEMEVLAWVSR